MNPILQNLLARKGKNIPVNDGRKIVLGLFGGMMISARGAAALCAFEELGITNAFDEIYTYSSGFPNSCYFLTGQMKLGTSVYYQDMGGLKFMNWLRPWKLITLDYLVNIIKQKKPLNLEKLYQTSTKLFTMVTKVPGPNTGMFLELKDVKREEFYEFTRACTALPFLDHSNVKIGDGYYHDIFYNGALEDFVRGIMAGNPSEVILIYMYDWQRQKVHEFAPDIDWSKIYEFCPSFYAGRHVWLQKISRFETRGKILKNQCQKFGNEVKSALGSQEPVTLL